MAIISGKEHNYYCTIYNVTVAIAEVNVYFIVDGIKNYTLDIITSDAQNVTSLADVSDANLLTPISNLVIYDENDATVYTCNKNLKIQEINYALNSFEENSTRKNWQIRLVLA